MSRRKLYERIDLPQNADEHLLDRLSRTAWRLPLRRPPSGGLAAGRLFVPAGRRQLFGTESEAEAAFTLDGETRHYRIEAKDSAEVKLYQDGALIFAGSALGDPGDAILWREDDGDLADEVKVIVNGEYQKDDLWPSCGWLYHVAVGGRRETRGGVAFLLPMGALALLLFLDLRFPLLFWNLRHGLEVSGGEPTDWYYSMQRVGRITDIVGIFVLAALSFALH